MSAPPTEVLLTKVNDTEVTYGDLIMLGNYVLNAAAAVAPMRHASPAGLLDYAAPSDAWSALVLDFIRWCSRGTDCDASGRLEGYLTAVGWSANTT